MIDREKVINELQRYVENPNLAGVENYGAKIVDMPSSLIEDAIALLKAQELPNTASISSAIECLLHPQDADDSDMAKAIDTAVRTMRLLKAQEPIAPVKVNRYMETDENGDWFSPETYDCGNCGVELHGKANYCHLCGRAVKWE